MSTLLFFFLFFSVLKAINQDSSTVPTAAKMQSFAPES
jgi:hypothetical protein